jgi:hypothetical protein
MRAACVLCPSRENRNSARGAHSRLHQGTGLVAVHNVTAKDARARFVALVASYEDIVAAFEEDAGFGDAEAEAAEAGARSSSSFSSSSSSRRRDPYAMFRGILERGETLEL